MKHGIGVICAFLCFVLPAFPQSKTSPDSNKSDTAHIASAGEIIKIDAKKKTLQVRDLVAASTATRPGQGAGRRSGGGGGGRGGGGRRGGGGYPGGGGGGGGGRYPGGGGTGTNQAKEYKIFITKDTVMQFAGVAIEFTDLHVGDRMTFAGTPKGTKGDLVATTISRE